MSSHAAVVAPPCGSAGRGRLAFGILGELEVRRDGVRLPLHGPRRQALLAILLLHANETLTSERLIDELWGEDAPGTAPKMIQNNVWQLRKLLEPDAARRARAPQVLVTRARGYELRIDPDEVDANRFERLADEGRRALAAGDAAAAAGLLPEALALWRGPALADFVHEPFAEAERARLEQLRLAALEERVEADLALAATGELVAELESLVARHPLRERLRGQLMLALYRTGRQADALAVYQRTRQLLVDELGIEPGPALQRLERAILLQEPELDPAPPREADRPAVRELRKTISVLAVELRVPGPRRDPEVVREPLARAHELVSSVLARHGASVERGSVGVFGVPAAHEDDALRAVRAAAEVAEALGAAQLGLELAFRAGVDTGEALVGPGGAAHDAVERAARLAQAAPWGETLVCDATRRAAAEGVHVEPAAADETPAWRLVSVVDGAAARRLDAPLVGRARELGLLRAAFESAVRERLPHLFTVLGPAGIGKSRLALELAASLAGEAAVLVGRCPPYGEALTFRPLAEIVRQAGADLGLDERTSPTEQTFQAARRLFERLARQRPLALVFEDLHWAEPTLLDLVEHVADSARAPLLVLCLARPELLEDRPAWGGGKLNATSILLGPLSESESEALVAQLTADERLPPDALARIGRAAEGNPLFLEQMLALVREQGPAPDGLPVPPTIQALLAARLDRLPAAERAVLEVGSVVGREFSRDALGELDEGEPEALDARLAKLVRRELIRPAGDDVYRFGHALLREAAYESVPKQARSELHRRFADWLERAAGADDEVVGHHLEQAFRYRVELGRLDDEARALAGPAAARLAAAGRRAYARGDVPAAVRLLGRAAALPGPDVDLRVDLGEALRETGDFERADAVFAEAQAAVSDPVLAAHVRVARLRLQLQTDPEVATEQLLAEAGYAVALFGQAGDERRLAKAWELLAWVPWFRCRAAAAEVALQRAIEHARRAGDARTEAQSSHLLLGAAWFGPTPVADAVSRCEEILARHGAEGRVAASALRALAGLRALEGDFAQSRELIARDRTILDELGLKVTAASAAETYAIVELLAGDPVAAERELRRGHALLEQMGETHVSILGALLAEALHAQDRDEEALAAAELAERATPRDDLFGHVQWRAARAKALAALGRTREAEPLAREAVRLAAETDFLVGHGDALVTLAETLRQAGRRAEAAGALERALRLYARKGSRASAERARRER